MRNLVCLLASLLFLLTLSAEETGKIDLSGQWRFSLDEQDIGEKESWFDKKLADTISLPGTTDEARKGTPNKLEPALQKPQLLRLTRKYSYLGAAWYQRDLEIPASWADKRIELKLERVLWKSQVWLDGELLGTNDSLTTPHYTVFPLGLKPGRHTLAIRIDNRKQYSISEGDLAHAYTNDTQIMWNGVLGEISLTARDSVYCGDLQVYPDVTGKKVHVSLDLPNHSAVPQKGRVTLTVREKKSGKSLPPQSVSVIVEPGLGKVECDYPMGNDPLLWSEHSPDLYEMTTLWTTEKGEVSPEKKQTFGMRQWSSAENKLLINGHKTFLRGTLECCIFPLTGTPPLDAGGWRKVFGAAKSWGLNHLRFHSWCPPKAAFEAADELGVYLQIELPLWYLNVGDSVPTNDFLTREGKNILREYGNHPSFSFFSMGNELQGDFSFLNNLKNSLKEQDSRHLYAATSFSFQKDHGDAPESGDDFFITQWTKKGWVRGQGVFNSNSPSFDKDFNDTASSFGVPLVTHEIGQYSVYPDLDEIPKYTGVLDPLNFKAIKVDLESKGMLPRAKEYLMASGKLAAILYKEEIERAMKTESISGFQLLDLHDFPGQGTALVGLLNAFWDSKGILSADEFRQSCAEIVPLARFEKAAYTNNEVFRPVLEIAQYKPVDLNGKKLNWSLATGEGKTISSGSVNLSGLEEGYNSVISRPEIELKSVASAAQLLFSLSIEGTPYRNSWKIWVYPGKQDLSPGNVVVTQDLKEAQKALEEGRNVLFNPSWKNIRGIEGKFLPVFWSPVHFPKQAATMGVLCDPHHPALREFPTSFHSDWQWWDLTVNSTTVVLNEISPVEPIIEMIDNWVSNRRLASTFQARSGNGKLVYSTIDVSNNLDQRPVARQLLYSLLKYMNSPEFSPKLTLPVEELKKFDKEAEAPNRKASAEEIY